MASRAQLPFNPIISTSASFNLAVSNVSSANALESTALNRIWQGPSGRAIRIAETGGIDVYIAFGTTLVVAASTDCMMLLGNTVEIFTTKPGNTCIAAFSSTTTTLNLTLGYGQ